jgi:hypothetical protein
MGGPGVPRGELSDHAPRNARRKAMTAWVWLGIAMQWTMSAGSSPGSRALRGLGV